MSDYDSAEAYVPLFHAPANETGIPVEERSLDTKWHVGNLWPSNGHSDDVQLAQMTYPWSGHESRKGHVDDGDDQHGVDMEARSLEPDGPAAFVPDSAAQPIDGVPREMQKDAERVLEEMPEEALQRLARETQGLDQAELRVLLEARRNGDNLLESQEALLARLRELQVALRPFTKRNLGEVVEDNAIWIALILVFFALGAAKHNESARRGTSDTNESS